MHFPEENLMVSIYKRCLDFKRVRSEKLQNQTKIAFQVFYASEYYNFEIRNEWVLHCEFSFSNGIKPTNF